MLTNTQWLLEALKNEIEQTGAAEEVVIWDSSGVDRAMDALRSHPKRVVFVIPDRLDCEHQRQGGIPVLSYINRTAVILCCASEPGKKGGDLAEATALFDAVFDKLMWDTLGTGSVATGVVVLPSEAEPIEDAGDVAPGRAMWRLVVKAQCKAKPTY